MNIAFFISDHGFGHIMRNVAVIDELLQRGHRIVLVTGKKHLELAKQYLAVSSNEENLVSVEMHTDGGLVVKPGTLLLDVEATTSMVEEYVKEFPERIKTAKEIFSKYSVDKVVVDIVPWALTASKEAGIPSFFMASFTWVEQYEHFLCKELLEVFKVSFGDADSVLMYELANEPTLNKYPEHSKVGFVARPINEHKVQLIKEQYSRPIVFLSLGGSNSGLDFDIDVSDLQYDFITTEGLRLQGDNVHFLPINVENTQDYMKAADYCISKAGWSSVSELMLAGSKTALLLRPDVPEDTMIIRQLEERGEIISISVDEIKDMESVLQRMETKVWPEINYCNGYKHVADVINM